MELPPPNYDEARVPPYRLPELLRTESGAVVDSAQAWREHRRPELLELFRRHVYGRFDADVEIEVTRVVTDAMACGGAAVRSELDVGIRAPGKRSNAATVQVLVFEPARGAGPFPAFLGLNLYGNQTVHPDPALRLAAGWLPEKDEVGLLGNVATEASRGMHAARFPIELLLSRGYALVTAYVGDIDPDFDDQFQNGA